MEEDPIRKFFEDFYANGEQLKKEILNHPKLVRQEFSSGKREEAFMEVMKYCWTQVRKGNDDFIKKLVTRDSRKSYIIICVSNRLNKACRRNQEKTLEPSKLDASTQQEAIQRNKKSVEAKESSDRATSLYCQLLAAIAATTTQAVSQTQKKIWLQCTQILDLCCESPEIYLKGDSGCHFNVKRLSECLGITRPTVDARIERIRETAEEIQRRQK